MVAASYYPQFAELLGSYLSVKDRSASWLAQKLRVSTSTVTRWLNGTSRPGTPERVVQILDILGVYDTDKQVELLEAAGYSYRASSDSATAPEMSPNLSTQPAIDDVEDVAPHAFSPGESVRFWLRDVIVWVGRPDGSTSWEGTLLRTLRCISNRFDPSSLLVLCCAILLWWGTIEYVGPLMAWPLTDETAMQTACLRFVLGLYVLPLALAILTVPEADRYLRQHSNYPRITVFFLKLTGALTGVFAFAGIVVILSLAYFYLANQEVPTSVMWMLCGMPLLFGFVGARRIPLDRYMMCKGQIAVHPADRWAFVAGLIFGPVLAYWLYAFRTFFADPKIGGGILLVTLILVGWLERRRTLSR